MKGTPERSPSITDGTAGESFDTAANTSGAASDTSHATSIFAVLIPPLHWSLMWLNNTIGGSSSERVGYARPVPRRLHGAETDRGRFRSRSAHPVRRLRARRARSAGLSRQGEE